MAKVEIAAPYIRAWEGGLSSALTDTASKNPSPWEYKGNLAHTSAGITYPAFVKNAGKYGYAVTKENFFNMPDWIWAANFREYWDAILADKINSQALATYAVSWVWGSGISGGSSRLKKFLQDNGINVSSIHEGINQLERKFGEAKAFDLMLDSRKQQFIALNQPANLKGWLNRLEWYRTELHKLVEKKK